MGIYQVCKWGVGILNDFCEFFGFKCYDIFESICKSFVVQKVLCDLYEYFDKVEFYFDVFCEFDSVMNGDLGLSDVDLVLWVVIFFDVVMLVRFDWFYMVDWNIDFFI